MKKTILLCYLACSTALLAQDAPLNKKHIFSLKLNSYIQVNNLSGTEVSLHSARPALELIKANGKGPSHMFELSRLMIRVLDNELTKNQFGELSIRYEIQFPIGNPLEEKAQNFSMGLGLLNSFFIQNDEPKFSNRFGTHADGYIADLYLSPKFRSNLTDQFFMDLSLLLNFANFSITESYVGDPSIPIRQQTTQLVDFSFNNYLNLGLRLGLGLRL